MITLEAKAALALLAGTVAMPATAQTAAPAQPAPVIIQTIVTPPDTSAAPKASPVSTAAQAIALKVFPNGTYRKVMSGTFDKMMNSMMDQMGTMPVRDLARIGGMDPAMLAKLDKGTLAEMMAIMDPAFKERMRLTTTTMMAEMIPLMERYEPAIRDGLAAAYQARFSGAQIDELNRFFDTPTGSVYASQQMLMFADPLVMEKMQAFLPDLMKAMPTFMTKIQAATAQLPKPRKMSDLTPAERAKLDVMLGITSRKTRK